MAKLYFRYGTVGSAKTLNLLAVAHNYRAQGKEVVLIRPELDKRFGKANIKSRAGLEMNADLLITPETDLLGHNFEGIHCILVDEAQFLTNKNIEQLRLVAYEKGIPVICYGLRTDFQTHLFEGSKRLLELADSVEEIKSTCYKCNKKSVFNLRHLDGVAVDEGPTILLGAEDTYHPACYGCYTREIASAKLAAASI